MDVSLVDLLWRQPHSRVAIRDMQALRNWQHRRKASASPRSDIPDLSGCVLDTTLINQGFFTGEDRVNCAVLLQNGQSILYGTNNGVFFQRLCGDLTGAPIKVLDLKKVNYLDILNRPELLVVSTSESVFIFPCVPTEGFGAITPDKGIQIAKSVSLLKAGECMGREMLCLVKSQKLSSTINILEPTEMSRERASDDGQTKNKKPAFKTGFLDPHLRVCKEFHVPTQCYSIHFLKTKLALACTNGFQIVDPETLEAQALLDPADLSLKFLKSFRDLRPVEIYRVDQSFLLCYTHCAFFVDKTGWKLEDDPVMEWSGISQSFAFDWPYLVILLPQYAEIRDVRNGKSMQIIRGVNFRRLREDNSPSKQPSGTLSKRSWPIVMASDSQIVLFQRAMLPRGQEEDEQDVFTPCSS